MLGTVINEIGVHIFESYETFIRIKSSKEELYLCIIKMAIANEGVTVQPEYDTNSNFCYYMYSLVLNKSKVAHFREKCFL